MGYQLCFVESKSEQQTGAMYQKMFAALASEINFLSTAEALFEHLGQNNLPDVIVLDTYLLDMDAVRICQLLQKLRIVSGIPVIVVSDAADLSDKDKALESGAFDYLAKPFGSQVLQDRVYQALKCRRADQKQRQVFENRFSSDVKQAISSKSDSLSLCLRRHYARARRDKHSLSLIVMEVELMEMYRAAFGREQGAKLFGRLFGLLQKAVPDADIYPYHETGFALVVSALERKAAFRLAEQISRRIKLLDIPHALDAGLPCVSVSLGTATLCLFDQNDCELLLQGAEQALSQAKSWGRSQVCQFLEL